MLDLEVQTIRLFQPPSGWLATDEGGERTSDLSKPAALRGLDIAFGLKFTTPPGGRSPPFTRGRGARPSRKLRPVGSKEVPSLGRRAHVAKVCQTRLV